MGVYNPNAIMPKNCAVCNEECKYRNITAHKRHKRCPLVEIKTPHGRLIDEDTIPDRTLRVLLETAKAPTVIEAEEGE